MKNIFEENFDDDELIFQEILKDLSSVKKVELKGNEEDISYCAEVLNFDLEALDEQKEG